MVLEKIRRLKAKDLFKTGGMSPDIRRGSQFDLWKCFFLCFSSPYSETAAPKLINRIFWMFLNCSLWENNSIIRLREWHAMSISNHCLAETKYTHTYPCTNLDILCCIAANYTCDRRDQPTKRSNDKRKAPSVSIAQAWLRTTADVIALSIILGP